MEGNREIVGKTKMLVPFRLNSTENCFERLNQLLCNLRSEARSNVDSSKYFEHIKDLIYTFNEKNEKSLVAYLTFFQLDLNKIKIPIPPLSDNSIDESENFNLNKCIFQLVEKIEGKFDFKIGSIHVVLNSKTTYKDLVTGFIVIDFNWLKGEADSSILYYLSQSNFFRFHHLLKPSNKKLIKNFIKIKNTNHEFLLRDLLEDLLRVVIISGTMPYLFHLVTSENHSPEDIELYAYKAIRNPGHASIDFQREYLKSLITKSALSSSLSSYAMSEGVVLVSNNKMYEHNLVNAYFPAFILALNQREIQLFLSERFNKLKVDKNGKYDSKQLRQMEGLFVKVRFDQFFKSVSVITEVNRFFNDMQGIFCVSALIEDNEDKIKSLRELAVVAEDKDKKDLNRKRDIRVNVLLYVITLFNIFSAVNDTFDLFDLHSQWTPHVVWVPIVATLIWAFLLFKTFKFTKS